MAWPLPSPDAAKAGSAGGPRTPLRKQTSTDPPPAIKEEIKELFAAGEKFLAEDGAQFAHSLLSQMGIKQPRVGTCYPVFDVIPHSFFEPMSYRIGVK